MPEATLILFSLIVLLGSLVQTLTGFAMGMLIVACVGALRMVDLPTLAAVVSLLTIINVGLALRGKLGQVDRHLFTWLALGQVPAIVVGVALLDWLHGNAYRALEATLGVFTLAGAVSLYFKPAPWRHVAGRLQSWLAGSAGGLVGGLFSASGPILGWFAYRQPLPVEVIRATLLMCFAITTTTRTLVVGVGGGLTYQVGVYAAVGIPTVVAGTLFGRWLTPRVRADQIKQGANLLLGLLGLIILVRALAG